MSDKPSLKLVASRRDAILEWLQDNAPYAFTEQRHLDPDAPERAYWHHGYQAALSDLLELACFKDGAGNKGKLH